MASSIVASPVGVVSYKVSRAISTPAGDTSFTLEELTMPVPRPAIVVSPSPTKRLLQRQVTFLEERTIHHYVSEQEHHQKKPKVLATKPQWTVPNPVGTIDNLCSPFNVTAVTRPAIAPVALPEDTSSIFAPLTTMGTTTTPTVVVVTPPDFPTAATLPPDIEEYPTYKFKPSKRVYPQWGENGNFPSIREYQTCRPNPNSDPRANCAPLGRPRYQQRPRYYRSTISSPFGGGSNKNGSPTSAPSFFSPVPTLPPPAAVKTTPLRSRPPFQLPMPYYSVPTGSGPSRYNLPSTPPFSTGRLKRPPSPAPPVTRTSGKLVSSSESSSTYSPAVKVARTESAVRSVPIPKSSSQPVVAESVPVTVENGPAAPDKVEVVKFINEDDMAVDGARFVPASQWDPAAGGGPQSTKLVSERFKRVLGEDRTQGNLKHDPEAHGLPPVNVPPSVKKADSSKSASVDRDDDSSSKEAVLLEKETVVAAPLNENGPLTISSDVALNAALEAPLLPELEKTPGEEVVKPRLPNKEILQGRSPDRNNLVRASSPDSPTIPELFLSPEKPPSTPTSVTDSTAGAFVREDSPEIPMQPFIPRRPPFLRSALSSFPERKILEFSAWVCPKCTASTPIACLTCTCGQARPSKSRMVRIKR